MIALYAAPPPLIAMASHRAPFALVAQVDPDVATLTAQPYLKSIRWVPVAAPLNTTIVAVLDTGVAVAAAGLQGRINTAGAMSFVAGGNALVDPEGHGTHVAGVIATIASGTSTTLGVSILPVQIADAHGQTSAQSLASGIRYAVSRRAKVINLSVQGTGFSKIEQDAINDATRAGVLVVAASGNTGGNAKEYPGAYRHVLAVGAVDAAGQPLAESTQGLQVAVAAPGRDILSSGAQVASGGPRFETRTGTSMAAAIISGVAARIYAARPTLSPAQVTEMIMASGNNPAGRLDRARGTGVVNLIKALRMKSPQADSPEPDDDPPNARILRSLIATGQTQGERYGRLRTWADLRDDVVVSLEAGQTLEAEANVSNKADVDLYLWRPNAPVYRTGAIFARKWLAVGAVSAGSTETVQYTAKRAGDYVLEVRLAGAQRIVRPTYHLQARVTK